MSKEYRRFTKEDWYGFAGCEKFSDGSEPFIYDHEFEDDTSVTVTIDRYQIDVIMYSETEEMYAWVYDRRQSFSSMIAEGYMRKLVESIERFSFGSELCYELDHPTEEIFKGFQYIGEC